jgi:hypothetical protein
MSAQEKAASVLDTPAAAHESKYIATLGPRSMDRKEFDTLGARFAMRGYVLQRVRRTDDERLTYHVKRNTQTRVFSHPHDLVSYLAVVEGSRV